MKQYDSIFYGHKSFEGIVIGKYDNLFELKKHPVYAVDLSGCYVSNVTKQKGGVVYIPAAAIPEKFFVISGKGPGKTKKFFQVKVQKYGYDILVEKNY